MLSVFTLGLWLVCFLASGVKRMIWPWRCEHCGWHEPDFRSDEQRAADLPKPKGRSRSRSNKWSRPEAGQVNPGKEAATPL